MPAVGAEALDHLKAVAVGQHDVEHHEVGPEVLGRTQRVGAGRRHLDVEAFIPEGGCDEVGDVRLVIHHENTGVAHRYIVAATAVAMLCAP